MVNSIKTAIAGILLLMLAGCASEPEWYSLEGKTMGSTYHIQYLGTDNFQSEIDKLLGDINQAVSTYIPNSVISSFNEKRTLMIPLAENGEPVDPLHGHFFANLEEAYEIYRLSDGYFDPTVGALVEVWGFGKDGHQTTTPDSSMIDSVKMHIGMQHVIVKTGKDTISIIMQGDKLQLDLNAVAQGYATDRVFELLNAKGVKDMFVEITGEVRVAGKSSRGDDWVVGINVPQEGAGLDEIAQRLRLENRSLATSGNYRNFYMMGDRKVWHTINPKTGYPEENSLLSATVTHPRCITADGLATACMAMGVDAAIGMIQKIDGADAYFIYMDQQGNLATFVTNRLTKDLIKE